MEQFSKFSWKVCQKPPKDFWTGGVEFYLDGASFTHKMNPLDQAIAPRAMVWRKPGKGLDFGFTLKRSHEGTGGSMAHFMEAIAYGKRVIAAEQYFGRIIHALTQKENCFCKMEIPHKIVVKPHLFGTK